ncbi:MAG: hypothetical protein KAT27_05095, partial [Desulfobacterales bacterium]|nr:hypothetical protein [Desulfobacterales bacterium]
MRKLKLAATTPYKISSLTHGYRKHTNFLLSSYYDIISLANKHKFQARPAKVWLDLVSQAAKAGCCPDPSVCLEKFLRPFFGLI